MGGFTALAITIHNFPEGIVAFTAALQEPTIGVAIAIAVSLHNIPEGIRVFIPIYYAAGSRKKALLYPFLSGLSEPLGAVVAFMVLMPLLNDILFGIVFASVAGIMFLSHWMGSFLRLKNIIKSIPRFMGFRTAVTAFSLQCFPERGKKLPCEYVIYSVHFSSGLIDCETDSLFEFNIHYPPNAFLHLSYVDIIAIK
ncbi:MULTISPECIES: ZIP family metal transporter [Salicibibacter]|uniref:ZIP family metal transporter n=1 Tax=Salicibibacter TaxID=2685905 RepID=UPI003868BAC1